MTDLEAFQQSVQFHQTIAMVSVAVIVGLLIRMIGVSSFLYVRAGRFKGHMVYIDKTTERRPGGPRFVLTIRQAYPIGYYSTSPQALLFTEDYPSRWQRWHALNRWLWMHRK